MRRLKYEFVVPSGIFLQDPSAWDSLAVVRSELHMNIRKPVTGQKLVQLDETIGNEGIDLHYSIMRVDVEVAGSQPNPEWHVPFQAVTECLTWIRVAGRQYWLGTAVGGTNSIARGSIIAAPGNYSNFGAISTPVIIPPLSKELWTLVGAEVASCRLPSIPDVLFCDALSSIHESDVLQAVIRLGVASELELNAFIDDLLSTQSESMRNLYQNVRGNFAWKVKNVPEILGAESYHRAEELRQLYELRGSAVHRAECLVDGVDEKTGRKCKVPVGMSHISRFVFAVEDFMRWTKAQRNKLGLATTSIPYYPIRCMVGGG